MQNNTTEVTFEFNYVVIEGESVDEKIPSHFDPSRCEDPSLLDDESTTQDKLEIFSVTVFSNIKMQFELCDWIHCIHHFSNSSLDEKKKEKDRLQPGSDGHSTKSSSSQSSSSDLSSSSGNETNFPLKDP